MVTFWIVVFVFLHIALKKLPWVMLKKHQRKEDRLHNLHHGAIGEPNFVRALTPDERAYLKRYVRFGNTDVFGYLGMAALATFITYAAAEGQLNFWLCGAVSLVLTVLFILLVRRNTFVYYLDLRTDAVRQIQGELVKQIDHGEHTKTVLFTVRGITFSAKEIPFIANLSDHFDQDEEVTIEYSPYSRQAWRLASVNKPNVTFDLIHPDKNNFALHPPKPFIDGPVTFHAEGFDKKTVVVGTILIGLFFLIYLSTLL